MLNDLGDLLQQGRRRMYILKLSCHGLHALLMCRSDKYVSSHFADQH